MNAYYPHASPLALLSTSPRVHTRAAPHTHARPEHWTIVRDGYVRRTTVARPPLHLFLPHVFMEFWAPVGLLAVTGDRVAQ